MSLKINHNITALDAWRNLTMTTNDMQKSMEKLSSGYRINRAADDPAGLVISEQFRAQIAGLNQAVENAEGAINMIQTAEGALTEINNLLITMRELAIHAANTGANDENQILADENEIQNAIQSINRVATNTQFGTKKLLDGSADNVTAFTTGNTTGLNLKDSTLSSGAHSITATKTTDPSASFNITTLGISTPTSVNNLSDGTHNVDVIQASDGATKYSGTLEITDAWSNGMKFAAAATHARIAGTFSASTNATGAAATVTFQVDYQESVDGPIGTQTLTFRVSASTKNMTPTATASAFVSALNTAINNNTSLAGKIEATVNAAGNWRIKSISNGTQYSVKAVGMSSTSGITFNWAQSMIGDSARGTSQNDTLQISAVVATSNGATYSYDLTTLGLGAATTINTASQLLTIIGSGLKHTFGTVRDGLGAASSAKVLVATVISGGQTKLKFYMVDEGSEFKFRFQDSATSVDRTGLALNLENDTVNVEGTDALVSLDGYVNTIDDVRYYTNSETYRKQYTLYDSADTETRGSVVVDVTDAKTRGGINLGNILMDVDAAKFSVRLDGGQAQTYTAGEWQTLYNDGRTESVKVKVDLTSLGGTEQLNVTDQSLTFQVGANVGQTANVAIQNMQSNYLATGVTGNQFSSLEDISIMTAAKAQDAQEIIDEAIDEVTTLRGNLGSFQRNTLEATLSNLRIASQNLTASESTIRDTDMALEMSNFVRYQILLQSGTSMLAQGNQIPQVALSLFR